MSTSCLRFVSPLCVMALILLPTACKSNSTSGGGSGAALSGPPVIDPVTSARLPRECSKVTHRPSASEAAALNQCATELKFSSYQVTYQDVNVELGNGRSFSLATDAMLNDADPSTEVIPIRGSQKMYTCSTPSPFDHDEGFNCRVDPEPAATGACWKTSFGDWTCKMTQISTGIATIQKQAPPKTY